jgi:hypothetical protein
VLKYGAWVDCGVMGNRRAVDYLSEVQRCMGRMRGNSYPSGNILSINLDSRKAPCQKCGAKLEGLFGGDRKVCWNARSDGQARDSEDTS